MTIANKPTTDELRRLYVDLDLTQTQIAAKYATYQNTVKHWLRTAGIAKTGHNRALNDPKRVTWLETAEELAPGGGLVAGNIGHIGPIGPMSSERPTDAELRRLYVDERLSHQAIGERYGVPASTAKGWCKRAGLVGARERERAEVAEGIEIGRTSPIGPISVATDELPPPVTPAEAALLLRKASESVHGERARAVAKRLVAWARRREFLGHREEELL